ncbi:MAG: TlpA family protein disulfide reductase [Rickettsiaceae bacterium]
MIKFSTKMFLWFISLNILIIIHSAHSFAENSMIIKPENSFIPDENFFDKEGNKVFLDQFEGKTILVNFWASWCGSCVEELPSLDVLQKDFRKLPFEVIAVSEDFKGIDAAEAHFNKYGIRHLKLYHDYQNSLFRAMSVVGLPTAFLINPEGKIKFIFKGNTKWHEESIRNILLSEIKGNPEIPKNSYITTSLNKKITPITTESEKKNDEQNIDKKKTDIKNNDQSQQTQSNITEDKKLEQKDENNK